MWARSSNPATDRKTRSDAGLRSLQFRAGRPSIIPRPTTLPPQDPGPCQRSQEQALARRSGSVATADADLQPRLASRTAGQTEPPLSSICAADAALSTHSRQHCALHSGRSFNVETSAVRQPLCLQSRSIGNLPECFELLHFVRTPFACRAVSAVNLPEGLLREPVGRVPWEHGGVLGQSAWECVHRARGSAPERYELL